MKYLEDDRLYFAYGLHPKKIGEPSVLNNPDLFLEDLDMLCGIKRVVALGEVGQWQKAFRNVYFGFSGLSTGPHCHKDFPGVIMALEEHRILLKTDSPHLYTGTKVNRMNSPYLLWTIAQEVAKYTYRELPVREVLRLTCDNARRCFRLSH